MNNDWNDIKYALYVKPKRDLLSYLLTQKGYDSAMNWLTVLILCCLVPFGNLLLKEVVVVLLGILGAVIHFYFRWNADEMIEVPKEKATLFAYATLRGQTLEDLELDLCSDCRGDKNICPRCLAIYSLIDGHSCTPYSAPSSNSVSGQQGAPHSVPRPLTNEERDALDRAFWKSVKVVDDGFEKVSPEERDAIHKAFWEGKFDEDDQWIEGLPANRQGPFAIPYEQMTDEEKKAMDRHYVKLRDKLLQRSGVRDGYNTV